MVTALPVTGNSNSRHFFLLIFKSCIFIDTLFLGILPPIYLTCLFSLVDLDPGFFVILSITSPLAPKSSVSAFKSLTG